jgi:DNA repair protein RadC
MTYQPIKRWAADERPREKFVKNGPTALSDAELLAILIQTGGPNRSALDVARDLMELNKHDLNRLGKMRLADLRKVRGIGFTKAITLSAALELGRRRESVPLEKEGPIKDSLAAVRYLLPLLKDHFQEVFVVLYLNQASRVVHVEWLSKGGIASTVIDTRLIMRVALEQSATCIILCHNHPAGTLQPSQADIRSTHRVQHAATLLDIRLMDHVIVSDQGWYSFADQHQLGEDPLL